MLLCLRLRLTLQNPAALPGVTARASLTQPDQKTKTSFFSFFCLKCRNWKTDLNTEGAVGTWIINKNNDVIMMCFTRCVYTVRCCFTFRCSRSTMAVMCHQLSLVQCDIRSHDGFFFTHALCAWLWSEASEFSFKQWLQMILQNMQRSKQMF